MPTPMKQAVPTETAQPKKRSVVREVLGIDKASLDPKANYRFEDLKDRTLLEIFELVCTRASHTEGAAAIVFGVPGKDQVVIAGVTKWCNRVRAMRTIERMLKRGG